MYYRNATCKDTSTLSFYDDSTESTAYSCNQGPAREETLTVTCPPGMRTILDLWKDYVEYLKRIVIIPWKYKRENKKIINLNSKVVNVIIRLCRYRFCQYRRKVFKGRIIRTH